MLHSASCVKTALIPVAGKGTRLGPITSVVPKAMLPIVDSSNRALSVLHIIASQVLQAGIERIGVIVSPWQHDMLKQYFAAVGESGSEDFPATIEYIIQSSPKGFGDAVLRGADFVGDEPFVLLLGDHIHVQAPETPSCIRQVVASFADRDSVAMVGVQTVPADELSRVGVCRGAPVGEGVYKCTCFVEKPSLTVAREKLVTEGLPVGAFLAHCGIYVFSSEIFECLRCTEARQSGSEIELAHAQSLLLGRCPDKYFLCAIKGRAYDVGTPAGYAEAYAAFRDPTVSHATNWLQSSDSV